MAFKIPDGQEVKEFGFTVYDADTGDPTGRETIAERVGCDKRLVDDFAITEDGFLYLTDETGYWYTVPREDKYIIQFASSGRYMRY